MYGLANQALGEYVRRDFGESAWNTIRDGAGVGQDMFVSIESYPDDLTFRLVEAAIDLLGAACPPRR